MSIAERLAFQALLERIKPKLSLEIGTYQGGSLQVLSHYSQKVVSVDIDPKVETRLKPLFANVEFRTGNSTTLLPSLVEEMNGIGKQPDFVLIDADHSAEAVRRDIEAVLQFKILKPMVILMHDSFNPDCRAGILSARWVNHPQVAAVEVDFVQGIFHEKAHDTAAARTMWGGLACAYLEPKDRKGPFMITQSHEALFRCIYPLSSHQSKKNPRLNRLRHGIRRCIAEAFSAFKRTGLFLLISKIYSD